MQPAASIPPFDPETLKNLVGLSCKVPVASNPNKFWWAKIVEVSYISPKGALVLLRGGRMFGKDKWFDVCRLVFKKQVYDELAIAVIKARGK